jgi:hypothetical protein
METKNFEVIVLSRYGGSDQGGQIGRIFRSLGDFFTLGSFFEIQK